MPTVLQLAHRLRDRAVWFLLLLPPLTAACTKGGSGTGY